MSFLDGTFRELNPEVFKSPSLFPFVVPLILFVDLIMLSLSPPSPPLHQIQEDIELYPPKKSINIELANLIAKQLEIMDRGIRIHSTKVCEAMKPLGAYMETNYEKMRKDAVHWVSKAEGSTIQCKCARCASGK